MLKTVNFVIFGSNQDLYKIAFSQVLNDENVRYISSPLSAKSKLARFFFRIHFSKRLNSFFPIGLKSWWNSKFFNDDFGNANPIVFIFFHNWFRFDEIGLFDYLKSQFRNAKTVCYFQDLLDLQENIDTDRLRSVFDLVITYDSQDAIKNNFLYHPTVYSKWNVSEDVFVERTNVYFLGSAKNRFPKILRIYYRLMALGLKCDFFISDVDYRERIPLPGLRYITTNISYEQNLQYLLKADAILEVMQNGATGYTMRTWESIMYDKVLITDNSMVCSAPFFDSGKVLYFAKSQDIFLSEIQAKIAHEGDNKYKKEISPANFLKFINIQLYK